MPLTIANPDSELGRIFQIIEAGIQPRIVSVQVKVIGIPERDQVILIRVSKSWNSPHMVSFVNRTRFYLRNNIVGKVQLDVEQIGAVFAVQCSVGERLRAWKADRIGKMIAGEGPKSLQALDCYLLRLSSAQLSSTPALRDEPRGRIIASLPLLPIVNAIWQGAGLEETP